MSKEIIDFSEEKLITLDLIASKLDNKELKNVKVQGISNSTRELFREYLKCRKLQEKY